MAKSPETVVREWIERAWNQKVTPAIDDTVADRSVARGFAEDEGPLEGADAPKAFHRKFCEALPNLKIAITHTVIAGADVRPALRDSPETHLRRQRRDGHASPGGFSGMSLVRVESDRIVEGWNVYDFLGLYRTLGVV